jgi:mercuric ion transport protein
MKPIVDLVFFQGCPHAAKARQALADALSHLGIPAESREWDLTDAATPQRFRAFGSPTILVDGTDVTGEGSGASAMACRADGAPSVGEILRALGGGERPREERR